jgi:CheY-like chemotaxis protein
MAATVNKAFGRARAPEESVPPRAADLGGVQGLAAIAERVLEGLCDGTIEAAPDAIGAIADGADRLRAALDAIGGAQKPPPAATRAEPAQPSAEFERARADILEAFKIAPADAAKPFDRLARLAGELQEMRTASPPSSDPAPASARMPVLIVECAGALVALPGRSIVEMLPKGAPRRIELDEGRATLEVRGRVLEVAVLADVLSLNPSRQSAEDGRVIVARAGAAVFCLLVDRVFGADDVAVAPRKLARSTLFSGAAILSDGSQIVLIDMKGVAAAAGVGRLRAEPPRRAPSPSAERVALLVFRSTDGAVQAAPLSIVARIQAAEDVECVDGRWMTGRGDRLIPVLSGDGRSIKPPDGAKVIVLARDGREIALAAAEVFEVAESFADAPLTAAGGLTINGRAAELIDVNFLWRAAEGDAEPDAPAPRALVMDESAFGEIHLAPLLTHAGYEVAIAADPEAALARHDRGERFDLILVHAGADTPPMLAALRRARDWRDVPVLGLDRAQFDARALLLSMQEALQRSA